MHARGVEMQGFPNLKFLNFWILNSPPPNFPNGCIKQRMFVHRMKNDVLVYDEGLLVGGGDVLLVLD